MSNTLIVGNSSGNLNKSNGKRIDSEFDAVVRFNDFQITGYEKYVGTKTDYIWLSLPYMNLATKYPESQFIIFERHRAYLPKVDNKINYVPPISIKNKHNKRWSSGIYVIKYFLDLGHTVTICGICDGENSHYWDTAFTVWKIHSLSEDKRLLKEWNVKRLV
jgi:hypothetical protein